MSVARGPDMILKRGDTYDADLVLWADEDKTTPYDLTGAQVAAEVRKQTGSPVLAEFVVTVTLPNEVHLNLPSTASELLPYGSAVLGYDVQATWPGPIVHTLVEGKATVPGDITDSDAAVPGKRF